MRAIITFVIHVFVSAILRTLCLYRQEVAGVERRVKSHQTALLAHIQKGLFRELIAQHNANDKIIYSGVFFLRVSPPWRVSPGAVPPIDATDYIHLMCFCITS